MELPLNIQPQVKTYLHHAIVNAIIDCQELVTAQLLERERYEWDSYTKNVTLQLEGDTVCVKSESDVTKENKFFLTRKSETEDEVVLCLQTLKNARRGAHVNLLFGTLGKRRGLGGNLYRMCIHQYGITTMYGGKHRVNRSWNNNSIVWYRMVRNHEMVSCYLSYDGKCWDEIETIQMKADETDAIIGVFGDNLSNGEYGEWLAMNYIQLRYDPKDEV